MLYIICLLCLSLGGIIGFATCALLTVASVEDDRAEKWSEGEKYKLGE